jgi:hypothetical protein
MQKIIALVIICLFAISCGTIPFNQNESNILKLVTLINQGPAQKLSSISNTPFILDAEIIVLPDDILTMWENLQQAGFKIIAPQIVDIEPVNEKSYREFTKSWEVESFFKNYVADDAVLVHLDADNGQFIFILGQEIEGYTQILGFKGPKL